jgi:hypothetical protein
MEAVAERMGYHVVGHHPPMPGAGKIAQALVATCRLEDGLHASMMTIVLYSCKTVATATSGGNAIPQSSGETPIEYAS